MKNQSGTIKTNPGLYRVVMGGSGGYRKLPGGSDDFSWQTDTHTLHHNIYIIIVIINIIVVGVVEIFAISDLMMTISSNAFVTNYFTIPIVLTSKISVLVWICLEKGDQPQNMIIIINQK